MRLDLGFECLYEIHRQVAHVLGMAPLTEPRQTVEQQAVLANGFLAQFMSAGGDILLRTFRDRRPMNRFAL